MLGGFLEPHKSEIPKCNPVLDLRLFISWPVVSSRGTVTTLEDDFFLSLLDYFIYFYIFIIRSFFSISFSYHLK